MSLKDFQILSKLGEGTYSSVYRAKRLSDGQEYALKKVKLSALSEKERLNSLNEVRLLASMENPFIIGFKEVFLEDNQILYIVMEFAGGGDIYNAILQHQRNHTNLKEKDIWRYAVQMIIGLKTLHDKKILHRDLKCANIFLSKDEKTAKLGDLNVSKVAKDRLAYTQTGTPYYASPEVWRDEPYDAKSDIWSLGCVIYEICALKPPFRAKDMPELFKKVQKGSFERIPSQYSNDLNTLISYCLQVNPAKRPTCGQLLEHHLVKKNCQGLLENLNEVDQTVDLLKTIKFPKNLKNLRGYDLNLPKPNYRKQNKSISVQNDGKGRNYLDYNTMPNPSDASVDLSKPNSGRSREKSVGDSFDAETFKNHQVHPQKREMDAVRQSRPAEVMKMNIKRAMMAPKGSDTNVRARRVKDILEVGPREGKSVELVRAKPNLSQDITQELKHRTKTMEGDLERKLYMIKKRRDKVNTSGLEENSDGRSGGYNSINSSSVANSGVKNTSSLNLEKGSLGRMYEDRIDAMDRRAKQLIQKYQYDVELLKKSNTSSKRASPDLLRKRNSKNKLERPRVGLDVIRSSHVEAYTGDHSINLHPKHHDIKKQESKRLEERKRTEESVEQDHTRGIIEEKLLPKVPLKPAWWG